MSPTEKGTLLAPLLARNPIEFYDRVKTRLEVAVEVLLGRIPPRYPLAAWDDVLAGLESSLGRPLRHFMQDGALARIQAEVTDFDARHRSSPNSNNHDADLVLAQLIYLACRALEPSIVLETGVCHGLTSAFILEALGANSHGVLHSVDLPPLGSGPSSGALVPPRLHERWVLHRGTTRRLLPSLVAKLGVVDIFVHDSLHTLANMRNELKCVTPYLTSPAVVIADDVESNGAFQEWVVSSRPSFWAVIPESRKASLAGIGVFSSLPAEANAASRSTSQV